MTRSIPKNGSRRDASGTIRRLAYAAVFLAAALVYLPALRYGFIGYDDTLLVVDNAEFLSDFSNAPRAFLQDAFRVPGFSSSGAYYRPVMTLSLMLDAQVGGQVPAVYHASNVLAHAVASCLVLALLASLGFPVLASAWAALLFAVHPAFVSVVAWVPGRVDALLTIYVLLSVIFLLEYLRKGGRIRCVLHLAGFALAAFTKEIGVLLPVPLAAYLLAIRRGKLGLHSVRTPIAGWVAVLVVWFVLRRIAVSGSLPVGHLVSQFGSNLVVLVHYLGKAFVPVHLSVAPTVADTPVYPGLLVLAALTAALVLSKVKRPAMVAFGIVWFLAFAAPPLIVPRVIGLEQRLYLPMIGLPVLLLEAGVGAWLARTRWALAGAAAIVVLFAATTVHRVPVYQSRLAFWESAVASSPHSSYARASLGAVYMSRGRSAEARSQYLRALELNPGEPKANVNLGVIAGTEGRVSEAQEYFRKEISVNPAYADGYFNLAQSYAQMGDLRKAAEAWRQTLQIEPKHAGALRQLARYYADQGERERAAELLRILPPGP